jgi:hypothetical protein
LANYSWRSFINLYTKYFVELCEIEEDRKDLKNYCVCFWMDMILKDYDLTKIVDENVIDYDFFIKQHFGFGLFVRNWMRLHGFTDKKFNLNLDDIYIEIFVEAVKRLW